MEEAPILGLICGGGPAPGLNGVISAATIYAQTLGWTVYGFHDGYAHLASGNEAQVRENIIELTEEIVSPYAYAGGSIIRTDRHDPTESPQSITNINEMLKLLKIRYLIIIGGNDKIKGTHIITQGVDPAEMQVIAIPKTIDNDINLPADQSTFGFHSARKFGTELVKNLIVDAKAAPRWFVVELMGRNSGHLALSVQEASGAQLAIIPEDFEGKKVTLSDICDIFEGAIIKRLAAKKNYGVCVISEGLINTMTDEEKQRLYANGYIKFNKDGTINLDDAELSRAIRNEMNKRLAAKTLPIRVNPKKIGYELRCTKPVSFDAIYCQELGYGAIEGLRQRHSNCIVIWENGKVFYRSFRSIMNPQTGKIVPRLVDVHSQTYHIAREYMWHLKPDDFKSPERIAELAEAAKVTPEQFLAQFGPVAKP